MFKGKITKLTSGAAMLGVAPTLALQAQGGVDVASKEAAMRFLEEGNNASLDFKKFGIGAVITILVVCLGWYAACVYFNKLALDKFSEVYSSVETLTKKKDKLGEEIKKLEGKELAYKDVKHDTEIKENDSLKNLKLSIKEHKAKIKKFEEINFEEVKKEYDDFYKTGRSEMEKQSDRVKKEQQDYENKNSVVRKLKGIWDSLKEFKDSADLLLNARNAQLKYEKVKKEYESKEKFIKENEENKLKESFEEEKKGLILYLEEVIKTEGKSGSPYEKFTSKLSEEDIENIGGDMVDLGKAKEFISSYSIDANEDSFKKLSKYEEGILKQLDAKDGTIDQWGVRFVEIGKYDKYAKGEGFVRKVESPLKRLEEMEDGKNMKKKVVKILEEITERLQKMLECQTNLKTASEHKSKGFEDLLEQKKKLEKKNNDLQNKCKDAKVDWKNFKENIDTVGVRFKDIEKQQALAKKKGFFEKVVGVYRGYFEQFENLGKIDEIISINDVEREIEVLEDKVEKLKPKKTAKQLEQEISNKEAALRRKFSEAKNLKDEAEKSEKKLTGESRKLEESRKQKVRQFNKLVRYLVGLEKENEKLDKNIYKPNFNPMKYYNEVNELIKIGNEIQNV